MANEDFHDFRESELEAERNKQVSSSYLFSSFLVLPLFVLLYFYLLMCSWAWGDWREIGVGVGQSLASSRAASQRGGSMAAGQQISLVEKRKNEEERPSESEERVDNGNNGKEEKKKRKKKFKYYFINIYIYIYITFER